MTRQRVWFALLISIFVTNVSFGQDTPGKPTFEVATVKPSAPLDLAKVAAEIQAGKMPRLGAHVDASRAEYTYMALKDLIAIAYNVKAYQITGPAWLASERFDILAKMPEGSTKEDAPVLLQQLLADRFKLAVHRDTQEQKVFALVVHKHPPLLKESPASVVPIDENAPLKAGELKIDGPDGPIRVTRNPDGSVTMNMGKKGIVTQKMDMETKTIHIESSMVTMAGFADMLTQVLQMGGNTNRQVVDQTGLQGNYQVALDISMADALAQARAAGMNVPQGNTSDISSDPGGGTSVFASVERLGLKLEPGRATLVQLIVDSVQKTPTEN